MSGFTHEQTYRGKTDDWLTPKYIIDELTQEPFGAFDLDPCTPKYMPWETAKKRYSTDDDGLFHKWEGRVWLNPPYGPQTGEWLNRLCVHGNGIALIFARTETKMFFKYVWNGASSLLFLQGRLSFCYPDGNQAPPATAPSVLIAYGQDNNQCLCDAANRGIIKGKYVLLKT